MRIDAFLCDSATVREGLLHVLGGGITRLWRERYPADFNVTLAMMIALSPAEAGVDHVIQVTVTGADGEPIAQLDGQFSSQASDDKIPGESIHVPLVLPLQRVPIPKEGQYAINVLIDNQEKVALSVAATRASKGPH